MRTLFIFIFTIMTGIVGVCAENRITGSIFLVSDNSPVAGANILIKDVNGKIVAYGVSASDGSFSIKVSFTNEKLSINATMIGFKPYSAPLAFDGKPLVIKMKEGPLQLQEVVVKSDRIRESVLMSAILFLS